jgi:FkbM family methyltransferase
MSEVYEFSNGIRLRRRDLVVGQLQRYAAPGNPNLHEPVEEEWLVRSFDRGHRAGSVFLDVGAGVGYYSFLVKKRWPDAIVVAFEALSRHADALDANRVLNGLAEGDVTVIRAAVGPQSGRSAFIDNGYGSALTQGPADAAGSRTVETRSLRDVLDELPPVHVMKMDIQGSELEVLTAAGEALVRRGVRHVLIGTHGPAIHDAVVDLLAALGYTIELNDPRPPMQPDGLVVAHLEGRA